MSASEQFGVSLVDKEALESFIATLQQTALQLEVQTECVTNYLLFLIFEADLEENVLLEESNNGVFELGDALLELNGRGHLTHDDVLFLSYELHKWHDQADHQFGHSFLPLHSLLMLCLDQSGELNEQL